MTRRRWIATLAGAAALLALGPDALRADPDNFVEVERGRYLATVGDCIACHSVEGRTPYAGGRGVDTPFGTILAPNLTPDPETGLGRWTADDFWRAMHEGVRPNGARLYPAFPYPYYTRVTRRDTDAIFAFLQSLPPERHAVDRSTLPFPFNIRFAMRGWNLLFFEPEAFRPDPARSEEWNRGAYLFEGLGHCGACHTPKNVLGADKDSQRLHGQELQAWFAPSLTTDPRRGIGDWSVDDIVEYLKTGANARSLASGPMAEVVGFSTALMQEADLRAIAVYMKEPRPGGATERGGAPPATADARMPVGEALYIDNCSACHRRDGQGVERLFPPLAGSQVVQQEGAATLLRIVLQGVRAVATDGAPTSPAMPAFGWRLDDEQVASVVTYVRNSWGNGAPPATGEDARRMRARLGPTP